MKPIHRIRPARIQSPGLTTTQNQNINQQSALPGYTLTTDQISSRLNGSSIINNNRFDNPDLSGLIQISQVCNAKNQTNLTKTFTKQSPNKVNHNKYDIKYLPKRQIKAEQYSVMSKTTSDAFHLPSKNILEEVKTTIKAAMPSITNNKKAEADYWEFRTNYIIKYAQCSDSFQKTKKFFEWMNDEQKEIANEWYDEISKIFEINNQAMFSKIQIGQWLEFPIYKNIVTRFYQYATSIVKLFNISLKELKLQKDNNLKLAKKNFELETSLNQKIKELEEINLYINKYDLNTKIAQKRLKEISVDNMKQNYSRKEKEYILTIYNWEDEIRNLTSLWNKNKGVNEKYATMKEWAESRKREIDDWRVTYNKEREELNIKNTVNKEDIEYLKIQLNELDKQGLDMIAMKEAQALKDIEYKAKVETLEKRIESQNETIDQLEEQIKEWRAQLGKTAIQTLNSS